MKHSLNSRVWGVLGVLLSVLLTACGGASSTVNPLTPTRVIAFGDALSTVDVNGFGTYTVQTGETNNTVASRLASQYSIVLNGTPSGTLAATGGFSYASGTARVSDAVAQINTFLASNTIGAKDMFVITVGDLDIYDAAPTNNTTAVRTAVQSLVAAIHSLTSAGAQYVLVMQPINMRRTPWAIGVGGTTMTNAENLSYDQGTACLSFSCQLTAQLNALYPATSGHQPILLADLISYFNLVTGTTGTGNANTFASYGVSNPDVPACTVIINANTNTWCTTSTVTTGTNAWNGVAWDYTASIFADNLNLTPFGNRLLADYIFGTMMVRAGWR